MGSYKRTNTKEKKQTQLPTSFLHKGKYINNPNKIADNFNDHFCNIGSNLSKKFDKISTNYKKHLDGNYINSMFLSEIKSSEVEQITSHLKANKSTSWA